MTESILDTKEFRAALGSFATGVTVVTTATQPDEPIGVTASSFNSVSLDPPLVLWSLAKKSKSLGYFRDSGHFAVHILSSLQEELSNAFAQSGEDKFDGVGWSSGKLGSPVLDEFAAKFECRTMHQYEGGDHIIFVGEVIAFDQRDEAPLLFHGGQYAETRPRIVGDFESAVDIAEGRFTDDFLLYLVSRAHFQSSRPTREKLDALGLNQCEYMTLAVLSMTAPASASELAARLDHTGFAPEKDDLAAMVQRGLIDQTGDQYNLAEKGKNDLVETLAVAKAFEDDLLDHFTPTEIADTKRVLKKLIDLTGTDVPELWSDDEASK